MKFTKLSFGLTDKKIAFCLDIQRVKDFAGGGSDPPPPPTILNEIFRTSGRILLLSLKVGLLLICSGEVKDTDFCKNFSICFGAALFCHTGSCQ